MYILIAIVTIGIIGVTELRKLSLAIIIRLIWLSIVLFLVALRIRLRLWCHTLSYGFLILAVQSTINITSVSSGLPDRSSTFLLSKRAIFVSLCIWIHRIYI